MMPFKRKYLYSIKIGYKREQDRSSASFPNSMHFMVVVPTKDINAAIEKAKKVAECCPGVPNIVETKVFSVTLEEAEECY